jgi:hypothetical protein
MYWELWDAKTKNLVSDFATEGEALQAIREVLSASDPDDIDVFALVAMYDAGESRALELPPALTGEALRARLSEVAQSESTDAARSVHDRIRRWLTEENWRIRDVDDSEASLNVLVTVQDGLDINIYQRNDHLDHVTVAIHWIYNDEFRSTLSELSSNFVRDIVWGVYRDVSIMGVQFHGLDTPTKEMIFREYIYFDGLTKDSLVQKLHLLTRALSLAIRTFRRALEDHGRSAEATAQLVRMNPTMGNPLSRAS